MAIGGGNVSEHQRAMANVLNSIPTHEEPPQTMAQIARRVSLSSGGLPVEYLEPCVASVIGLLTAFDVLSEGDGRYRSRGEMPTYFRRSCTFRGRVGRARRTARGRRWTPRDRPGEPAEAAGAHPPPRSGTGPAPVPEPSAPPHETARKR